VFLSPFKHSTFKYGYLTMLSVCRVSWHQIDMKLNNPQEKWHGTLKNTVLTHAWKEQEIQLPVFSAFLLQTTVLLRISILNHRQKFVSHNWTSYLQKRMCPLFIHWTLLFFYLTSSIKCYIF
jgi:hypothetical protein